MSASEMLTPEAKAEFFPCRFCSNITTPECWDHCMPALTFRHYRHRPGTDILDYPPLDLEKLLAEPDPFRRLLTISSYLKAVVDQLQHIEEFARNRELYKNGGENGDNTDPARSRPDAGNMHEESDDDGGEWHDPFS